MPPNEIPKGGPPDGVGHFPAPNAGPEGRSELRKTLWLRGATLRERGCSPAPVIVRDLSPRGFCCEWHYPLTLGDVIWLKLPGFETMASVVAWNREFQVGCRFQVPLHTAVFERIVAAQADEHQRSR